MTRMGLTGGVGSGKSTVTSRSVQFAEGRRQILVFDDPADVKGTGLLSTDYEDGDKDDDQWLYLPAMRNIQPNS